VVDKKVVAKFSYWQTGIIKTGERLVPVLLKAIQEVIKEKVEQS